MSLKNILTLFVLLMLLAVCFLSGRIAGRVYPADPQKKTRLDLTIKGACVAAVLILYIICFA